MTDITIPDEVVEAFRTAWTERLQARHAIAVMLNAWPGLEERTSGYYPNGTDGPGAQITKRLILPLPAAGESEVGG